ncbi:lasso peptide biosynthesis B2 protein [Sphingomonas sp. AP4-R1]|uniref:lasso peptide biosynthesis B2 protein n=1 Tax=Sphingomonas sp. AP4-R1 TaxID=2735134 RepID=UPI001C109400|nr:lasso peptide biosynthesis B2 protein [Sphingomonas sp. AP4-R1]
MRVPNTPMPDAVRPLQVRSSDGLVTLDIERDAYHCRYDPLEGTLARDDARHITRLWRELPQVMSGRLAIANIAHFTAALVRTIYDIWRLSFADLLDACPRAPVARPACPPDPEACARTVASFERLCLYVPFRFQCLFRSYLLLHFLRRHGVQGQWVFGVALFPFEAHCWVVGGEFLMGERAERIARLSPIHIVEPERP